MVNDSILLINRQSFGSNCLMAVLFGQTLVLHLIHASTAKLVLIVLMTLSVLPLVSLDTQSLVC